MIEKYIHIDCCGNLYLADKQSRACFEPCECCGDTDTLIGVADNRKDAKALIDTYADFYEDYLEDFLEDFDK